MYGTFEPNAVQRTPALVAVHMGDTTYVYKALTPPREGGKWSTVVGGSPLYRVDAHALYH